MTEFYTSRCVSTEHWIIEEQDACGSDQPACVLLYDADHSDGPYLYSRAEAEEFVTRLRAAIDRVWPMSAVPRFPRAMPLAGPRTPPRRQNKR